MYYKQKAKQTYFPHIQSANNIVISKRNTDSIKTKLYLTWVRTQVVYNQLIILVQAFGCSN